jgi:AraC-like DNA-binding protein
MAYVTKKDQTRYIELGNFVVDFNDDDVLVLDNVKDISPLYPLKPMTTLVAICCKGWQKISSNDETLKISEGDVLICPPNIHVSGEERSDDFDCKVICISDNLIRSLLRDKVDVWHRAVYVNNVSIINVPVICKQEFGYYFSIIRSKMKHNNPAAPHEIMFALLRALLLELCFILERANGITHEQKLSQGKVLFNRFLSLISNNEVKRQPISVYAGQLAITPKYLTMLCLKYSNKTASEWVAQYTVEEIRFFLKSTDLSIKEISARLGFSNMSHFGSYVRKHLGVSPSEFRFSKRS